MNDLTMYSTEDIANALGISRYTIREYIQRGDLKAVKIGRKYIIKPQDFHNFIDSKGANA